MPSACSAATNASEVLDAGPPKRSARSAAWCCAPSQPSTNPPGAEEPVARFLADTCDALRFRTEVDQVAAGRPNVYASLGPADELGLLFLVHTDTVPAG